MVALSPSVYSIFGAVEKMGVGTVKSTLHISSVCAFDYTGPLQASSRTITPESQSSNMGITPSLLLDQTLREYLYSICGSIPKGKRK